MLPATPLSFGQSVRQQRTTSFRLLETRHPQGMVLGVHEHEHACVNFVLEGCYREDFGRKAGAFEALSSYYKPAGEPHSNCFRDAPARCLLVELDGADLNGADLNGAELSGAQRGGRDRERAVPPADELFAPGTSLARVAWTESPAAARTALAIWRELAAWDPFSPLAVDQMALELYETVLAAPAHAQEGSARVRAASETLHDSPRERWTLSALAREVGLHPSHLARAFRARHDCTIGEYLRRLRLNEVARTLALGEQSISELALLHGFSDQSHCTRSFRRQFGTTPAAYRRAFRAG